MKMNLFTENSKLSLRKPINIITIIILAFIIPGFESCRSTPPPDYSEWNQDPEILSADALARMDALIKRADQGDFFEENTLAITPTIGILKPRGSYLSEDEQWIPDMIKSAMNNNFRKFAAGHITVMNIADEEALNDEVIKSLSGSEDELSLTARMAARSLMTGNIIKVPGTTRFTLEFTVTDTETHAILAVYSQNHSDIELTEGIAVNKAAESLLKDLNVRLNEAGRYALYGASNEADTALAKGLNAAESGQGLQAMNYLFNAASYNTTATQASAPLTVVQNRNRRELQGAGSIVMDYFERQELWQNRLDEFNNFYNFHAPFELYYTPPTPTNMRGAGTDRAYDLQFRIGLRWSQNQIAAMEKVLQEYILDGLYRNSTEDIRKWELKGLPDDSYLFMGPGNFKYDLMINVENERGEIITSEPLVLYGSLYRYQGKIYADCTQEFNAVFRNIKYNREQMTSDLYIRVVSINGVNIRTAGESGFIRVAQTQDRELPPVQQNSLPRGLLNTMEREQTTARRQQQISTAEAERQRQEREREAEKQRQAWEKERKNADKARQLAAIRNSFRVGIGAYGGPTLGADAGTIDVNLEVGSGAFDFEFGLMFYPGTSDYIFRYDEDDDIFIMGFNFGLCCTFIGLRTFFNIGPGLTVLYASDSTNTITYYNYIPNLVARLDWRLFGSVYLRLGYRFDLYPNDLTLFFKDNSFNRLGNYFYVHNILFGLGFITY